MGGKKYNKTLKMKAKEVLQYCKFVRIFPCSGLLGNGVQHIEQFLIKHARKGEWFYLPSTKTNLTQKQRVVEVLREKIFCRLNQEFPYMVEQATDKWQKRKDGSLFIVQRLFVARKFQMGILIGHKGRLIERIRYCAKEDLEEIFNCKVELLLSVSVRKKYYQPTSRFA